MRKVMYQGVELTIHERADWEPKGYPVKGTYRFRLDPNTGKPIPGSGYLLDPNIFPRRNPSLVTHQAIHYTADDELPDGEPGESMDNLLKYLQAMQISYCKTRAYSVGYSWFVDWLGGIWECRGRDIKCAAHTPANDYADAILVLVDLGKPVNAAMARSISYLTTITEVETGRQQIQCGHRELKGTSTQCPGDVIVGQIHRGEFRTNPTTNPIEGVDVSVFVQADDGDPAVFCVTGQTMEWISTEGRVAALAFLKTASMDPTTNRPRLIDRGFFQHYTLLGPAPKYPDAYRGPRTTSGHFSAWVQ